MKKKSSKLRKLESSRYSILTTDFEHCFICGKPKQDIHEIYGGGNRQVSMKYGFCVPLCRECHRYLTDHPLSQTTLKQICQLEFLKNHEKDEFLEIIGRNFL